MSATRNIACSTYLETSETFYKCFIKLDKAYQQDCYLKEILSVKVMLCKQNIIYFSCCF